MSCSYCGEQNKLSGEHLIPQGLLDLFAECDYNVHLKLNDQEKDVRAFKGDHIVIKDVCEKCNNNQLSVLDNYGIKWIEENFYREYLPDDMIMVKYNYNLLTRWILKIIYNNVRAFKSEDVSWFNNQRKFILEGNDNELEFSIFLGLAVDMSPLPEFFFDNMKLSIYFNPFIVSGSALVIYDHINTRTVAKNPNLEPLNIKNSFSTCLIRFGSLLILTILWEEGTDKEYVKNIEKIISQLYPYNVINEEVDEINIKRATHAYNFHYPYIVDTEIGLSFADSTNSMLPNTTSPSENRKKYEGNWPEVVKTLREQKLLKKNKRKK